VSHWQLFCEKETKMKNLQSLFVVVLLVASSIGILMLPSEQGGRMIAAMFGKLKPASETQRVGTARSSPPFSAG